MFHLYVEAYTAIWAVVAVATYQVGRRLSSDEQPPDHPLLTSILAGVLWPVVVAGLVEAFTITLMSGRPPPPAPLKVKDSTRRGRRKNDEAGKEADDEAPAVTAEAGDETAPETPAEAGDEATETADAGNADDAESDEAAKTSGEGTAGTDEDEAEEKATDDTPAGKLRNRRSGKGSGLFGRGA